jgi:hypothetical protein
LVEGEGPVSYHRTQAKVSSRDGISF